MQGSLENIVFNINPIEKMDNSQKYQIILEVPMSRGFIDNVKFIILSSNEKHIYNLKHLRNEQEKAIFTAEITLQTKAIYHYYFSFTENQKQVFLTKNRVTSDTNISLDETFKTSVNFEVPNWAKGQIMYHIFIDRFKKENNDKFIEMPHRTLHQSWNEEMIIGPNEEGRWNADFYGGNLKGIIEKLDYIKSLGVSIIYLSPLVKSQSNHRYDTADYEEIDPYVGTEEDLKKLCQKAHEKGMKIILDAVFNHTGNDSKYFNEFGTYQNVGAYQSTASPYYNFYRKQNDNFDYWWGMKNLPVCDGNSKEWQEYIYGKNGIIDKWFNLGIDGLRLDVADELTDEFIEGIRSAVKRNKEDGFIIGEVWKNPMRMNRNYISSGKGMDSVMNYLLVDSLIRYFKYSDTDKLKKIINEIKTEYPDETILSLMNFTSTHDITRAINIFGTDRFQKYGEWAWDLLDNNYDISKNFSLSEEEYKKGKDLYESYIFALTFMPGILSIFYGDEVGLEGEGNLSNRKPFPWNNIDNDLLNFFIEIGKIRAKEKFLEKADFNILDINDRYLMFERSYENESSLTFVSRIPEETEINIPSEYENHSKVYTLKKSTPKLLMPSGGITIKKRD